jgi:hypothetical protein
MPPRSASGDWCVPRNARPTWFCRRRPFSMKLMGDHDVLAKGSILIGVGIIAVGMLALLFRNPRAPRWTKPELVAMLVVVPVVGTLGLGLGYVLVGGYQLWHGVGDPLDLAVLVAVALVVTGAWWFVIGRLRAYETACALAAVVAESDASHPVLAEGPPAACG